MVRGGLVSDTLLILGAAGRRTSWAAWCQTLRSVSLRGETPHLLGGLVSDTCGV